jgi:CRP-like cAMP-binding protein
MRAVELSDLRRYQQRLANYPLFERASGATVSRLVKVASIVSCSAGEPLCVAGAAIADVHVVLHGVVRLFHRASDGRAFTAKLMTAPNHIGDLQRLAGGTTYGGSASCLTECVVAVLPFAELQQALSTDHGMCLAWLGAIAQQFAVTIDLTQQNLFADVTARIAHFLCSYVDAMSQVLAIEDSLRVDLSREELAGCVGSVRRSVIRSLHELEAAGVIDASGPGIIVRDREQLALFVGGTRKSLSHRASYSAPDDVDHCA